MSPLTSIGYGVFLVAQVAFALWIAQSGLADKQTENLMTAFCAIAAAVAIFCFWSAYKTYISQFRAREKSKQSP